MELIKTVECPWAKRVQEWKEYREAEASYQALPQEEKYRVFPPDAPNNRITNGCLMQSYIDLKKIIQEVSPEASDWEYSPPFPNWFAEELIFEFSQLVFESQYIWEYQKAEIVARVEGDEIKIYKNILDEFVKEVKEVPQVLNIVFLDGEDDKEGFINPSEWERSNKYKSIDEREYFDLKFKDWNEGLDLEEKFNLLQNCSENIQGRALDELEHYTPRLMVLASEEIELFVDDWYSSGSSESNWDSDIGNFWDRD